MNFKNILVNVNNNCVDGIIVDSNFLLISKKDLTSQSSSDIICDENNNTYELNEFVKDSVYICYKKI